MITGELKNKVDKIWEIFWTGGITNPLEVIEQFNYLLFIKQLDEVETRKERDANILGIPYEGIFPADCQQYRWSKFKNLGDANEIYDLMMNEYFHSLRIYIQMENLPTANIWEMQSSRFQHQRYLPK